MPSIEREYPEDLVPPKDKWGEIEIEKDGEKRRIRVPFDNRELEILAEGQSANKRLIGRGASSGIEREYWISGGQFFPTGEELLDRPNALRMLRTVSKAAMDAAEYQFPIGEDSRSDLTLIQTLASRFTKQSGSKKSIFRRLLQRREK